MPRSQLWAVAGCLFAVIGPAPYVLLELPLGGIVSAPLVALAFWCLVIKSVNAAGEEDDARIRRLWLAPPGPSARTGGGPFTLKGHGPDDLDAARYRYLRNFAGNHRDDEDGPMVCAGLGDRFEYLRGEGVDAAVDAAIALYTREETH